MLLLLFLTSRFSPVLPAQRWRRAPPQALVASPQNRPHRQPDQALLPTCPPTRPENLTQIFTSSSTPPCLFLTTTLRLARFDTIVVVVPSKPVSSSPDHGSHPIAPRLVQAPCHLRTRDTLYLASTCSCVHPASIFHATCPSSAPSSFSGQHHLASS